MPTFFAELTKFLEALGTYCCSVLLLCDFSVYLNKMKMQDTDELIDLLASFDMFRMGLTLWMVGLTSSLCNQRSSDESISVGSPAFVSSVVEPYFN